MGFKEKVMSGYQKGKEIAQRQQQNASERKMTRDIKEKMDRASVIQDAEKARTDLKELKQYEKAKSDISKYKEEKRRLNPTFGDKLSSMSSQGQGYGQKPRSSMSSGLGDSIFDRDFGMSKPVVKTKPTKRKKKRTTQTYVKKGNTFIPVTKRKKRTTKRRKR